MVSKLHRSRSIAPAAAKAWPGSLAFLRASRPGDRGAVAVEFALILPVFLFLLFFMIDAGRYLTVQLAMNNAAQVGARSVALGQDVSTVTNQIDGSIPLAIIKLATMDPGQNSGAASVPVGPYLCPILSELNPMIDPSTGETIADSDGNCVSLVDHPDQSCTTALPNYRAMAKVSVTFKWLTPMGLIVNLVAPEDVGAGNSIFFDRNSTDTTTISGKAKLICQN
jgi:Flp pilus assembly protein TadG